MEKEKDGATIKSKKNAQGRKVRMIIFHFLQDIFPTLTFSQQVFLIRTFSLFQVWMCEVVTPVPASKLWAKLQVFISNFSLKKGGPFLHKLVAAKKHFLD